MKFLANHSPMNNLSKHSDYYAIQKRNEKALQEKSCGEIITLPSRAGEFRWEGVWVSRLELVEV